MTGSVEQASRERQRAAVYRAARTALAIGLSVNLILGVVKGVAGYTVHSFALLADSLDMLADATVYGIALSQWRMR